MASETTHSRRLCDQKQTKYETTVPKIPTHTFPHPNALFPASRPLNGGLLKRRPHRIGREAWQQAIRKGLRRWVRLGLVDQLLVAHGEQAVRLRLPVDGVAGGGGEAGAPDAEGAVAAGDSQAGDAFGGGEGV